MNTERTAAMVGNNQYTAPWTKYEEDWIIRNYPTSTREECLSALPGRTTNSIKHKASRMGIKKTEETISKQNSKINKGRIRTESYRMEISLSLTGKTQSDETKQKRRLKLLKSARREDNHPNWKGNNITRDHTRWRARRLVPKGRCAHCGGNGDHVHHKDGNPYNNDLNNLVRLCKDCHVAEHRRMRMEVWVQPEEKQAPAMVH